MIGHKLGLVFFSGVLAASKGSDGKSHVNTCKPFIDPTLDGGSWFISGPAPTPSDGSFSDGTTIPFNVILSAASNWPYDPKLEDHQEDWLVQYFTALNLTVKCYSEFAPRIAQDRFTADLGDGQGSNKAYATFRETTGRNDLRQCDAIDTGGLKVTSWVQLQPDTKGCVQYGHFLSAALYTTDAVPKFVSYDAGREELVRRIKKGGQDWINATWPGSQVELRKVKAGYNDVAIVTVAVPDFSHTT